MSHFHGGNDDEIVPTPNEYEAAGALEALHKAGFFTEIVEIDVTEYEPCECPAGEAYLAVMGAEYMHHCDIRLPMIERQAIARQHLAQTDLHAILEALDAMIGNGSLRLQPQAAEPFIDNEDEDHGGLL